MSILASGRRGPRQPEVLLISYVGSYASPAASHDRLNHTGDLFRARPELRAPDGFACFGDISTPCQPIAVLDESALRPGRSRKGD